MFVDIFFFLSLFSTFLNQHWQLELLFKSLQLPQIDLLIIKKKKKSNANISVLHWVLLVLSAGTFRSWASGWVKHLYYEVKSPISLQLDKDVGTCCRYRCCRYIRSDYTVLMFGLFRYRVSCHWYVNIFVVLCCPFFFFFFSHPLIMQFIALP